MSKVTNVIPLAAFKTANNVETINIIKTSKGNLLAKDTAGNVLASVSPDITTNASIVVMTMVNELTAETWNFIVNGKPEEPTMVL